MCLVLGRIVRAGLRGSGPLALGSGVPAASPVRRRGWTWLAVVLELVCLGRLAAYGVVRWGAWARRRPSFAGQPGVGVCVVVLGALLGASSRL